MSGDFLKEYEKVTGTKTKKAVSPSVQLSKEYTNELRKTGLLGADDDIYRARFEDIGPVRKRKKEEEEEDDSLLDFFQKGSFSDGYQKWDVSKAILGTAGDAALGLFKGVGGLVEGVVDLGAYGVAGVADKLGKDDLANRIRKSTQQSQMDQLTKGATDFLDQYSVLGRTSDAILQGIGQVGGIVATGGLGSAAGLGAAGTTALTTGLMGVSGMGSGMGEAYKGGATDEEAVTYGVIAGASDAITELIFGGLGKAVKATGLSTGLSSADDMLAKKVSNLFTNQIAKNISEFGIKAGAEGLEEVLAGIAQAAGKKATYMSEEEFTEILKDENLLEQFVVGSVTSGIIQSGLVPGTSEGSLKQANKEGRDFITGQSLNEQEVIKKEIEKRIAQEEKGGKTLSKQERSAIEYQVEQDMERGDISIDTIEEALGGDTYKAYQEAVDKENEVLKEFAELYKGDELKQQVQDFLDKSESKTLREKLSQEVAETVKGDRLIESYNERARRKQAFQADLSKYDEKQKAVIQKAVQSKVLNNTRKTHEFVDFVAKMSADIGASFDFVNNEKLKGSKYAVEGKTVNGFVDENGQIVLNTDSSESRKFVVGHEITHVLEGTDLYQKLQDTIFEYAKSKKSSNGTFANEYMERLYYTRQLYKNIDGYQGVQGFQKIKREVVADLVGEYLFTDANFVNNLSTKNRNVFQKMYDEVKHLLKLATAGSKEAKELEKVKKAFDDAYRAKATKADPKADANTDKETGARYSIVEDKNTLEFLDGQELVKVYRAMQEIDGELYPPMAAKMKGESGKKSLVEPTKKGAWYQSDERPDLIKFEVKQGKKSRYLTADEMAQNAAVLYGNPSPDDVIVLKDGSEVKYGDLKYKFELDKANGATVPAAYNPYFHASGTPLNDQFSSAYDRPNLRVVEGYIPKSELDSGYKAMYAKDSVGETSWHAGPVASQLKGDKARRVFLSRWFKVDRVIPDAEAAKLIAKTLEGENLTVPWNVVTPSLRKALEAEGITIDYKDIKAGSKTVSFESTQKDVRYSISPTTDGRFAAVVDNDILSNINTSSWDKTKKDAAKKAASEALKQFSDGIVVDGITRKVNKVSRREYTRSNYTESLYSHAPEVFADKMRAADVADDIVVAATNWHRDGGLKHPRTDGFVDFDHGNTLIVSGDRRYSAEVVVGITDTGDAVFYDVVDMTPTSFDIKKEESPTTATTQNAIGDIQGDSSGDNVAQNSENVKYSLSRDSKGRELSPAVKNRFGNSKAVDEDGDLKALFHGTASGEFSIFDKAKGSIEGDFGSGFYFTDNEADVSEHYEGGGPDFENKVARRAEQIESEEDIAYDEAEERAREELYKGSHKFEVYLNIEKPAVVGETILLDGGSYLDQYSEEDYDDYDDYIADVEQLVADDIENVVWEVEKNVDLYNADGLAELLFEAYAEGGIGIEELKARINELYLEDNEGNLAGNEVTRQIIESLGYDGIIDPTVSSKWNMDIEEGTTHYIVFKPNQIKAVTNESPTDNPDIHRSISENGKQRRPASDPLSDLRYEGDPIQAAEQNVAPVQTVAPVVENSTLQAQTQLTEENSTLEDVLPDNLKPVQEELTTLLQEKEEIENRLYALTEAGDFGEEFNALSAEWSEKNNRINELEEEIEDAEAERLRSFNDTDAPPEMAEADVSPDVIPLTKKAVADISREVRSMLALANKDMADVRSMIEEYSASETPDRAELIEQIEDRFGQYTEEYVDEDLREAKQFLRTYAINVSDSIKGEIADYRQLMRSNFGKVRFSKDGVDVDVAYRELHENYPGLFPESVYVPTDQLLHIIDIANADIASQQQVDIDAESIERVADAIINGISSFRQTHRAKAAGQESKAAFNGLMADADQYVPPMDEDIGPVKTANQPMASADIAPAVTHVAADSVDDIAPTFDVSGKKGVPDGQQAFIEDAGVPKKITRKERHEAMVDNIKTVFREKGFDFDKVLKKAKNLSTFATVDNTPQRVMEKALGYKEGQVLADLTVNKVAQNETESIKWLNRFTNKKHGLLAQISKEYGIRPGSKKSAAAQMYAEGFYVDDNQNIVKYGDRELAIDFPDPKIRANIKRLAKDPRIRKIYDDTLASINESRVRNGYPEIPKLDNYFLHFRAMDDTFSKIGLPFNPNDIRAKDLPTDLNGVTADLKPGQPYFASAMHRKGKRTSFDMLGGLERYLTSAKNQIYHIDDIQTLRALRDYIANTYGQAHGLEDLDTLSTQEAEERIEEVYDSHLSTFAKFLNEEANVLAGKTSLIDRGIEGIIGRRGITFLDTLNKQVGANMVGFNISSSLTNFLSVAQAAAKTNKFDFVKGFTQMASNKITSIFGKNDGFVDSSPVMIRRKGAESFYRTPYQKVGDMGYVFMGMVDDISTELIARTKYNELTRKGMDSQQAHFETDKWVSRLMGDRSLGQQPQLYNSKMLGVLTKFQLEVRNQLDSQFYDTIQEAKVSSEHIQNGLLRNAKKAAKITSTFAQLAVLQHLFGAAFESVAGYNPAFDIIEILTKAFGWDDEEEDEDTVLDNLEQGFLELLGDMPYTSILTGGRIPISSALPVTELIKGEDQYDNEKSRWDTIKDVAPYYILPGGYGQIKKTMAGLEMFDEDHPIAGSYTDSGNLRFTVEDTPLNKAQAAIFGQYASELARDYFDNERKSLNEKQIEELVDTGMPIRDYWKYRDELSEIEKWYDKADYIAGLDLPLETRNILINNISDRKERIDLTGYENYPNYEEFDWAKQNPEKYALLQQYGISAREYKDMDSDSKGAYTWAINNPEAYTVSRAVMDDVVGYRQIVTDLWDLKADKDKNGKSINGSRKKKVAAYIDGLDIGDAEKYILFKSEYNSDDSHNMEIINYLNDRDDLSTDDVITILRYLGFTVDSQGYISW